MKGIRKYREIPSRKRKRNARRRAGLTTPKIKAIKEADIK